MLFGKDSFRKKNSGKYIVGYELGQKHVQMSYLKVGEREPQTLSMIEGQEEYHIPFLLFKPLETDLWYVGKEAMEHERKGGGILLTDLLENAYEKKMTEVNLENFDACASRKAIFTVPGAGHGLSYLVDNPGYFEAVREFFGPEGSWSK